MKNGNAANVLLAKAHAMYSRHLTEQNYRELLLCPSIGEVAGYLKTKTAFSSVLSSINERTVHRGYLEGLLHQKVYDEYISVWHFDRMMGLHLLDPILQSRELTQLLRLLRLMEGGQTERFLFDVPMSKHSSLDIIALSRVKNYDELLTALGDTPFAEVLAKFSPDENGRLPLNDMEHALQLMVTGNMQKVIAQTGGEEREELRLLWSIRVDSRNVQRIWRLKKYFQEPPDKIQKQLLPGGAWLPDKTLAEMLAAPTPEEVERIFFETRLGRRLPEDRRSFAYNMVRRVECTHAQHYIHFSHHPLTVLSSYLFLSANEAENLVHIIEGIRYHEPPERIAPMLVIV